MEKILVSLTVIMSILGSHLILRYCSSGRKLLMTPSYLFFLLSTVFIGIGAWLIYLDQDYLLHVLETADLNQSLMLYALHMNLGVFVFACGALAACYFLKFKPRDEIARYQDLEITQNSKSFLPSVLISLVGSIVIVAYFFINADLVPIIMAIANVLAGEEARLVQLRSAARESPIPGALLQFSRAIIPYLVMILWSVFALKRVRTWPFLISTIFFTLISLFYLLAGGDRGPVITAILCSFVVFNFILKDRISKKVLGTAGILVLALFATQTVILGRAGKHDNLQEAVFANIDEIIYRVFITQSQTGTYVYEAFPEGGHFKKSDIYEQNIKTYIPSQEKNSFSVDLFEKVHTYSGSASHSALAEAYASFGALWVFIFAFVTGFLFQSVAVRFVRGKKELARLVAYGFLSVILAGVFAMGSVTGLIYAGAITIILMYLILRYFDRSAADLPHRAVDHF